MSDESIAISSSCDSKSAENDSTMSLWDLFCYDIGKSIESGNFYKAADLTRNLFNQIDFECKKGKLSNDCKMILKEECLKKYGNLIDDQEGINNYAAEIDKLVITPNPASANWKSAIDDLSDDDLIKLLPEDTVNPSKHDDVFQRNGASNSMNQTAVEFLKCATNPFSTVKDVWKGESNENDYDESVLWKKLNSIVSKCEPFQKKEFVKGSEKCHNVVNISSNETKITNFFKRQNSSPIEKDKVKLFSTPTIGSKRLNTLDVVQSDSNSYNTKQSFKRQKASFAENLTPKCDMKTPLQFQTAREFMGVTANTKPGPLNYNGNTRKCLGTRRGINSKFVAPILNSEPEENTTKETNSTMDMKDERLKNIDPKMVEIMLNEIMDQDLPLTWDNIAGLEFVKKTLKEIVVWPMLRPDIFTGLRGPPRGILLFGPPGTGKTLIGKCVASQSKSTFFSISASSLGSKWVGEGEKLVRALFAVARCYQPAVIFIDEIDSLLIQRSDTEHESSRRIKTEFLVQFDGVKTASEERLLIIGATNRPQELDEAARRRLVKRLYIPLPEREARKQIIKTLLESHSNQLSEADLDVICEKTQGYSGADMTNLCKEAALGPIRSISFDEIAFISKEQVRPIILDDFIQALRQVRASVSESDLGIYQEWNEKYGSGSS